MNQQQQNNVYSLHKYKLYIIWVENNLYIDFSFGLLSGE